MNLLKIIFGNKTKSKKQQTTFTLRQGKSVPIDDAFRAWNSGNLDQMLKAVNTKTNLIDRHFLLQSIVTSTYKLRKEEKYRQICIEIADKHLQEFPDIAPVLKEDMGGTLPRITTFQYYATILTEDNEYEKAILVCEKAIEYDLHDGTSSGFKGRIERIKKKSNI